MAQKYRHAPLPFIGQKRNFLTHFTQILQENLPAGGMGWTIVDAFGGSGLLSHTAKRIMPSARVIYNNFDGYAERLRHIGETNVLRRAIEKTVAGVPKQAKLPEKIRQNVIRLLESDTGFKDLACLQTWLLFSGKQAESMAHLCSHQMYNCVRKSDVPDAAGYLDGLEITSESYRTLLPRFSGKGKTLLVLDPPYVCTAQGAYRNAEYFGMCEFLRLMRHVRPPFIFFSSTRSELCTYLDMVIQDRYTGFERFEHYRRITVKGQINRHASYEDNLIFKF